jgi:uncharacterized membrane protein YeaQ/YmgE (transglycosylase-associated protein family)
MRDFLQRVLQAAFGLVVGLTAWLLLPGHHSVGIFLTGALSLAGGSTGVLVAERLLPADVLKPAGFVVSALGAVAMLLIYGIAIL